MAAFKKHLIASPNLDVSPVSWGSGVLPRLYSPTGRLACKRRLPGNPSQIRRTSNASRLGEAEAARL